MKKILSSLLIAACAASTASAVTYSNKTFFTPRAVGNNLAMRHSGWRYDEGKAARSSFSATAFFQRSVNAENLGRYFGVGNGMNSFRVGERLNKDGDAVADNAIEVDGFSLVHNPLAIRSKAGGPHSVNEKESLSGTVSFKPEVQVYGTHISFHYALSDSFKDYFFRASAPILHVESNLKMRIDGENSITIHGKEVTLSDFLAGKFSITPSDANELSPDQRPPGGLAPFAPGPLFLEARKNQQASLARLKIAGRRSVSGIGDVTLSLGKRFCHTPDKYAYASVDLLVPAGSKVRGHYLFEPVCGNGQHLALGVSGEAGIKMWSRGKTVCALDFAGAYKYLFEATQVRYPTLKKNSNGMLGHYQCSSLVQKRGADIPVLEPLVNLLPGDVRVRPGSQLDAQVSLSCKHQNVGISLGYDFFWKDQESVWQKAELPQIGILKKGAFPGLAAPAADFTDPAAFALNDRVLSTHDFDWSSLKNPTQLTHKLFASFSYDKDLNQGLSAGLSTGLSYEFAKDNAALEQYAVWAKASVLF